MEDEKKLLNPEGTTDEEQENKNPITDGSESDGLISTPTEEENSGSEPSQTAADDTSSSEIETPSSENNPVDENNPSSENNPIESNPAETGSDDSNGGESEISNGGEIKPQEKEVTPTETPIVEENGAIETSIKTFTQGDVDKLVGDTRIKTREKTMRYIYDRYGVKNEAEMDALVENAQRFETQREQYESDRASWDHERDENSKKLSDMSEQIALMQSDINPVRYEDAKLILKGKGLDVTIENIQKELETHPEWSKEEKKAEELIPPPAPKPTMRIKALGNEQMPAKEMSEEEQAEKLFKMNFH